MKRSFYLICMLALLAVAPAGYGQERLTVRERDIPLEKLIHALEHNNGYAFFYNEHIGTNVKVNVDVRDKDITEVMRQALKETGIAFMVKDKSVALYRPEMASTTTMAARQPAGISVSGTVTDTEGAPLPGVNVVLKGTTTGTVTDADGRFSIKVPDGDAVLQVSFVGYTTQEVTVGTQTDITVQLSEGQELEEVVVVGFGTQKKVNVAGAITAVGADVFENRPVTSVGQALQGVVPNLNITMSSGSPEALPSFNIRGATTISDGALVNGSPLFLVDGVEVDAGQINMMNPNDIASMSVIKDASAAAIYGTKASNGVVLISTKSGEFNQRGKIAYSYDVSWDKPSALPDILDAYTIRKAYYDKLVWTGGSMGSADEKDLAELKRFMENPESKPYYTDGMNINWVGNFNPYEMMVRKWTPTQKHNLSLSGGTEKVAYYLSLGYQNQEGMYKINTDDMKRYNASMRINAKITGWFNVDAKVQYSQSIYKSPYLVGGKGSLWEQMKRESNRNINMPIKTAGDDPIPNTYTDNILAWYSYGANYKNTNSSTILAISPEFVILPNVLKVKADLSYTPQTGKYERHSPKHDYITFSWAGTTSEQSEAQMNTIDLSRNESDSYLVNAYVDFNKTFGKKHNVHVIGGFSQESYEYGYLETYLRYMWNSDILDPNASDDVTSHNPYVDATKRTGRSGFGRIEYNFDERYFVEMDGRYDGSSKFTANERFVFFPSFSAAWRLSKETFMEGTRDWLNNLKLRATWGELGSQPSSNYPYQATMAPTDAGWFIDGKWVTTVGAPDLVSPMLTWQKQATLNAGLDAAVLKNRLSVSFELFQRTFTDILTAGVVAYPNVLGAAAPLENSGSIRNNGWELVAEWRDRIGELRYNVGFTLSDAMTEVLKYPSNPTMNVDQLREGGKQGEIWGYEIGGILQKEDLTERADGKGYTWYGNYVSGNLWPGYVWYRDLDHNGVINTGSNTVDDSGDRHIIGNSTPRYKYSVTAGASWKGFDVQLFFQGVGQRDVWISSDAYWGSVSQTGTAGSRWMYDRSWTPERTDAEFPMYGANPSVSSRYLVNGAYFRLKQAILGYTLPLSLTQRVGVEKLRFTLSGYNLFEISEIPNMFDVDQISDAYPQKRTISIGAQIVF